MIQDGDGENKHKEDKGLAGVGVVGRDINAVVAYKRVVTVIVVATAINAGKRVASQAQLASNHERSKT